MTLICLASQKGSPGVSAAALAVAAALRPGEGRRKLLLEADVSGGVLAIRYRLPPEPGLVTLAAAARVGLDDDELWRHSRELPGGLAAVVCPDGPDRVQSALAAAGGRLGRHLAARRDVDVICDLGRLTPGSPAMELAAASTALLLVARPTAEQLQPAANRLLALRPEVENLGWLLVGERPHGPAEVETTFGFPVVGVLADDRRSVEAIEAGAVTRRVRRHPFVRSATTVADTLRTWLSPLADRPVDPADDSLGSAGPVGDGPPAGEPERLADAGEPAGVPTPPAAPAAEGEPAVEPGWGDPLDVEPTGQPDSDTIRVGRGPGPGGPDRGRPDLPATPSARLVAAPPSPFVHEHENEDKNNVARPGDEAGDEIGGPTDIRVGDRAPGGDLADRDLADRGLADRDLADRDLADDDDGGGAMIAGVGS